ncbi:Cardiolipin synthase produces cardiolipin [Blumeria graminis f. sp. tritici 96224]|uniref:Cardiolipin synthase produces cardiolipin n=1 Tax=Blumeria graminis f. sp. tritici 96224 TaxID=1268274 RepID=A0A656KJ18_BLUGR|nr:Cardiolipin synthase produces cardiolipin [Blumeria graminis f. sp. tritici 96224]
MERTVSVNPAQILGLHPKIEAANSIVSHGKPNKTEKNPLGPLVPKSQTNTGTKRSVPSIKARLFPPLTPSQRHENIYTIPNLLTFSRLFSAPVIGYLILNDHHVWALGLFGYAGLTDLLDGWIARRWNLQTIVGTIIDPMADKSLMTILTVCLAMKGTLPVWLATIILGRDVGLAIMAIYYRWISLPPPKTLARYWDFSLPSAEVRPTQISKYNTALQLALIGATTTIPLVTADISMAMTTMQYLVATTTIWSGASYIYSRDAVKILTSTSKLKEIPKKKIEKKDK